MNNDALSDALRLRLRDDLVVLPAIIRGERIYTLEDSLTGQYFQLGEVEFGFAKHLDGRTTLEDARRRVNGELDRDAFSPDKAATIARWLLASGLAIVAGAVPATPQGRRPKLRRAWSPVFFRIEIFRPDGLMTAIAPWLAWLFSPIAAAAALLLSIGAVCVLAVYDEAFFASSAAVFAPDQRLWTIIVWVLLKALHELGHAVVCKKYGGRVTAAGVALLLFAPLPYVDVTSSWRFRSKWERIFTAAAGMYVECLLAAVAVLAWPFLEPGAARQACVQIATMAALGAVVFNSNPLMRFDGYYILIDWLEMPNLYTDSQRYLRWLAKRHLLGVAGAAPVVDLRRRRLLLAYGVAAMVWRVVACVSLIVAAAYLFHGAGMAIALTAAVAWWIIPLAKLAAYLVHPPAGENPRRFRFATATLAVFMFVFGVVAWTPWPGVATAPAIVDFDPLVHVRAVQSGFVRETRVEDGGRVQTGDVIVVLEDEQLALEIAQLTMAAQQSEARCRSLQHRRDLAALQAEEAQKQAIHSKLQELLKRQESLTIRAPQNGVILARNLDTLIGRRFQSGEEVCLVAGASRVVRGLVGQDAIKAFREHLGEPVTIRLPGAAPTRATLTSIDPSASSTPPHAAFCALYGGPLAVTKPNAGDQVQELEFLEPQFSARIHVPADAFPHAFAGQRCEVHLTESHETVGAYLARTLRAWLRSKAANQ